MSVPVLSVHPVVVVMVMVVVAAIHHYRGVNAYITLLVNRMVKRKIKKLTP